MTPYFQNDTCTIYCCDCNDIWGCVNFNAKRADAMVTDPPYGIEMGSGDQRGGPHGLAKGRYDCYEDSYENFCNLIVPRLNRCLDVVKRAGVFTGPHIHEQRKMDAMGGIYCPAGSGRNRWGFKTFLPVLLYGQAPDLNKGARPTTFQSNGRVDDNYTHPCPKPLDWMMWLVNLVSRPGETVIDPFMGSGSTAVACNRLGRRFIGCEISEAYCKMTVDRMSQELFVATLPAENQNVLFANS